MDEPSQTKAVGPGRPLIEIDQFRFEELCARFSTLNDIAGEFRCSVDTIERWCVRTYDENFADVFKKKSAPGRNSLRSKQYDLAMSGNPTMLIWLGKQHLGQSDKVISLEIQPPKSKYKEVDL
jgi:hypothetical protein